MESRFLFCAAICLACAAPPALPAAVAEAGLEVYHDVRKHGAVGDGRHLDTEAIQAAIDAAAAAGGGVVDLPAGTYLSGALTLKDHVTLHLQPGAVLLGSRNLEDYAAHRGLIHAEEARDIAITGRGLLDGQGGALAATFATRQEEKEVLTAARARGKLIDLVRCRGVRVEGVSLRNSPSWMQHYFECDDVVIDGITVHNHCNLYNDGIDIDNCRDVRISNCRISSGDDAIVLKSRSERTCENVTITNCIVSSHSNGIKLGTESHGGFRNIAVSNCVIEPVDDAEPQRNGARQGLGGITLATVDGAVLEQVTLSNITVQGTIAPIFLRLGNRGRKLRPDMPTPPIGQLRNVTIRGVVATGASSVGCAIAGLPGHPVENVTLSDISIEFGAATRFVNYKQMEPGGTLADAQREIPENADAYPECVMFGKLPAYGLYARHVEGLTLSNVRVTWTDRDQRPALFCDDVRDLAVDALRARSAADAAPAIVLRDTRIALISGCIAAPDTGTFLGLQGDTTGVSLIGNELSRAARVADLGPKVPAGALFQQANRTTPHSAEADR